MKKLIIIILLQVSFLYVSAAEIYYDLHGYYNIGVNKTNIEHAAFIHEVVPGYPVNWITDYISVEIFGTCNGKTIRGYSTTNALEDIQRRILKDADPGSDILVNVLYKNVNAVTSQTEIDTMHVKLTVIPETEAEYTGGKQQMRNYLKQNVMNKISEESYGQNQVSVITFIVNEQGEISNAKITKSCGDQKTDETLIDAINKMPKWKPAENSKGIKEKQKFALYVGNGGC